MNKQYSEIANILKDKVDIIICETMASALEAKCALKAALETEYACLGKLDPSWRC